MRSEYSLHQRIAGTRYIDRMQNKRAKYGVVLMTIITRYMRRTLSSRDLTKIIFVILLLAVIVVRNERPRLVMPEPIRPRKLYSVDAIDPNYMQQKSGFTHE
jgi:hypothetical protein